MYHSNVVCSQGVGVFANEGIRARELVVEYVGERVTIKEAKRRLEAYRRARIPVRTVQRRKATHGCSLHIDYVAPIAAITEA